MFHSFINLLRTDPGFRPQQVLTASISLPQEQYRNAQQSSRFYAELIAALQSLPAVQSAGAGSDLPWTGYDENAGGFTVEGRPQEYNDKTTARYHAATPDYFHALGIPLLNGRFFTDHDIKDSEPVIIVNDVMAKRYWPGEEAVGKRISFNDEPKEKDWMRIVGVVGDIRDQPNSETARPAFWWAHAQQPFPDMSIVVRSGMEPAVLVDQLRQTLRGLDSGLAIADVRFMNQVADSAVSSHRFALFLVGLFAVLALVLATIGMYGVMSYSVNQRMHEFGIRMALGAGPRDLIRLIVGQGLRLSFVGAALGLLCAAGLARFLGSLLYGISGTDPATFAVVALVALSTTTLACYLPARRATGADPMRSLGSE
jgi:predicted permease